jgi:hypothetical protein
VADELIHAKSRFAALCWPKQSSKYGSFTMYPHEVTCIDCRNLMIAFAENREGLGIQTNKEHGDGRTDAR